jgi:para-aminobenzoate synthetase
MILNNFVKFAYWRNPNIIEQIGFNYYEPTTPVMSKLNVKLLTHKMKLTFSPQDLFLNLFKDECTTYWLDSSIQDNSRVRYSYMGNLTGNHSLIFAYDIRTKQVVIHGTTLEDNFNLEDSFVDYMATLMAQFDRNVTEAFGVGFIGYLSYEMRYETSLHPPELDLRNWKKVQPPASAFMFCVSNIVIDHHENTIELIHMYSSSRMKLHDGLCVELPSLADAEEWMNKTISSIQKVRPVYMNCNKIPITNLELERGIERYKIDIDDCIKYLKSGESYELCLTNKYVQSQSLDYKLRLESYIRLRNNNPSTFGAFIHFEQLNLTICSSSPELFLHSEGTHLEMKPIKGTIKKTGIDDQVRIEKELLSTKNKAENLMIVDLIRNDLSMICNNVHVNKLYNVEEYETLYQLVSTIRGDLREGMDEFDALKLVFPPGSMTGAPKDSSCKILNDLEDGNARGIYSGCLGFLSASGSCMKMSVVIRTAVYFGDQVSVGCGGAITILSDTEEEVDEMLLKLQSVSL